MSNKSNTPEQTKQSLTYDYSLLEPIFTQIATPREVAWHLDKLLYILFWYQEHEETTGYWHMYEDIYMLKEVLFKIQLKAESNPKT